MSKQKIINIVKSIILKYSSPNRIYLYGSQANGEAENGSDIDIAYDDENCEKDYLIKEEIKEIKTLIKIDVTNLSKCGDRFENRVKTTGKVLYSATKLLRAEDGLYNFSNALNKYIELLDREGSLIDTGNGICF